MKITAFNGSPKAEAGNTNVMVSAFLAGAQRAGAEIESIFLASKEINHCQGCSRCATSGSGQCLLEDDMPDLVAEFLASDVVILASPLHIDNVSGMLKVFMDRLICIGSPRYEKDANGEYRGGKSRFFKHGQPPKLVFIASCGYPQRSNFQVVSLLMKRIARNFHLELIAEIYATEGGLLTANIPQLAPLISDYKTLLQKAGEEITLNLELSEETKASLERNFIPEDIYVQEMNKFFDMLVTK